MGAGIHGLRYAGIAGGYAAGYAIDKFDLLSIGRSKPNKHMVL